MLYRLLLICFFLFNNSWLNEGLYAQSKKKDKKKESTLNVENSSVSANSSKEKADEELKNLLKLEGVDATANDGKSPELTLDVQMILTELRKPLYNIKVDRPTIAISLDDAKLGNIKLYIDEKAYQTFYGIKIEEMNVADIEK